jgi:hypothetical protein
MRSKTAAAVAAAGSPLAGLAAAGVAGNNVWAVGDQAAGRSVVPLIEHWDGSGWSVTPSPELPQGSQLTGVTAPCCG